MSEQAGSGTTSKTLQINTDTILFLMYMFYKCNIITRHHLKRMLAIIKEPMPENVAKFLVEEVAKAV